MACFVSQLLAPAEGFDQGQNAIIFFLRTSCLFWCCVKIKKSKKIFKTFKKKVVAKRINVLKKLTKKYVRQKNLVKHCFGHPPTSPPKKLWANSWANTPFREKKQRYHNFHSALALRPGQVNVLMCLSVYLSVCLFANLSPCPSVRWSVIPRLL